MCPEGQKITGRGESPCYWFERKQSAEGATEPIILSHLSGLPCGVHPLQGLHPCLCSDTCIQKSQMNK